MIRALARVLSNIAACVRASARRDFETLYWSELALVVDEPSLKAVNDLRNALAKDEKS